jgi:hypothetical protein
MNPTWDPITFVNLVLCIVILLLGIWGFKKHKYSIPILVAIAFGIFGLSHLMELLGLKQTLTTFLIIIRTIAYLLVVYAVYRIAFRR